MQERKTGKSVRHKTGRGLCQAIGKHRPNLCTWQSSSLENQNVGGVSQSPRSIFLILHVREKGNGWGLFWLVLKHIAKWLLTAFLVITRGYTAGVTHSSCSYWTVASQPCQSSTHQGSPSKNRSNQRLSYQNIPSLISVSADAVLRHASCC